MAIDTVFNLDKSVVDYRTYRYFQLENGLRVMVISNLKPGESIPPQEDSDEEDDLEDGASTNDGSEEEGDTNNEGYGDLDAKPSEHKSAAALCIKVGSFSDPPEAQGLSHFLEHMVFMGSEKYPTENDFDAHLSRRGGCSNAWTDNEHTMFYYDVKRKHFFSCLDRFAHFFISPLLQKDSTDRELAAVHSEYELSNARDSNRVLFLLGTLASKGSPYRTFGYGNMKSLRDIPEATGTDIYSLLQAHCKKHYSSERMTLAVISKDSLDNMEARVREIFASVPNSKIPPDDFSGFTNSFESSSFNKFYYVSPLGDREKLRIIWPLPSQRTAYDSTPAGIIASLVGHEGDGSILAVLKERNLAFSLSSGFPSTSDFENSSMCTLFQVVIDLTEHGRDHVNEVCQLVFDYLKLLHESATSDQSTNDNADHNNSFALRVKHTFPSYLPEYQLTRHASFRYKEPDEPDETVIHVANLMQLVPPEFVYSAYHYPKRLDLPLCVRLLELFTPSRAAIVILSAKFASSLTTDTPVKVEPWFNVRYVIKDIPQDVLRQWETSQPDPSLHLPYANKFLTSNFDLLPSTEDMKVPIDLNKSPDGKYRQKYGNLWFQQNTRFKCPKAFVTVHLWSPLVAESAKNFVLHMMLNYSLNQTLSTIAYEGSEANLDYTLENSQSGMKISVAGFSEKLFEFYRTILQHITAKGSDAKTFHFESYKDAIRQMCFNESMKSEVLNSHLQLFLLRQNAYLFDDLLGALRNLSMADLMVYKQRFFLNLRITAYVYGNFTSKQAIEFFDCTTKLTACMPLPERKFTNVGCFEPGTYRLRVKNCNPADVNMCIAHVHMIGQTDLHRSTLNRLLAYVLFESAFNFLRTRETLGYDVYLRSWRSSPGGNLHSGMSLVACSQANQFSVDHVSGRLTAFWYLIAPRIVASMTAEGFQTSVESLISSYQLEDPNMSVEIARNWEELFVDEAMFDRREAVVEILKTVTKEELMEFYRREYLDPANRRTLIVQVDAPPEADSEYVIPQKSYFVDISHVPITPVLKQIEQSSVDDVDISASISACGFDYQAGEDFLNKGVTPYTCQSPNIEESVCIDNIREFRSTYVRFEAGRVVS